MLPRINPMEPVLIEEFVSEKSCLYQVKWDGVRILANIENGKVELYTRRHHVRTHTYPEIVEELAYRFDGRTLILDGEMVAVREGRPDFFEVMKRDRLKNPQRVAEAVEKLPVSYIVFDLLHLDGKWLSDQIFARRHETLSDMVKQTPLIHVCPTTSDGEALLKFTAENGWEGIVIKEKDGYYHFGTKHPTWRKFKHVRELVATVLGLACKGGRVHSLLLGIRNGEKWSWIGKAATGLNQKALTLLDEWSRQAVCSAPALDRFPQLKEEVIWVKPVLKVKVQFMEWTPEGTLRAPVIKGFVT